MIGSPEKNIKGISGGERRRLAFACEVILKIIDNYIMNIFKKLLTVNNEPKSIVLR